MLSEAGAYRRSQLMDDGSEAFEIDPLAGHIQVNAGSEDFVAPTKTAAPPLILDEGYRDAVLRSSPWGYWRFESMAEGHVPNEVVGGPPLRAHGPIGLSTPAEGNRSAVFEDGRPGQYLALDGPWKPSRHPGFAVELWFLSHMIGHTALISMFADDPGVRQVNDPSILRFNFLLELTSRIRMKLHQPASVRLLHRFPPSWTDYGDNLYSKEWYVPYRWHHIVGQMNGSRMELFLDGEPTPMLTVDPDYSNPSCVLMLGRLTTIPLEHDNTSRSFVGRMDEVALYDHPLPVDEIKQHSRLRPASRKLGLK